jgi:phenylacetate-CoA ligase
MSSLPASYFDEADVATVVADYPLGKRFESEVMHADPSVLKARRERRWQRVLKRAWQVPFYARRWEAAGFEPTTPISLDTLHQLPAFTKSDLMASVADYPPFGDFHGMDDLPGAARRHVIFHSTSGTTGEPQPLFFGARDREVQNVLLARAYRMHGLRDEDVVHSVYGFGLVNGGHYVREAITHYTRALMLTPGTGVDTPSAVQVQLMARYGVTVLVGFADYLFRLAEVAQEAGLEPGVDLKIRLISGHIPHERREALSQAWGGAAVHDWYGVGDTGVVAAEGPEQDGLWVFEDAQVLEIVDADNGAPVPRGQTGNQCVTCLFKDTVYPIVRFDTQDLSAFIPEERSDRALSRIRGFLGRSDNMVKLRGINVYPTSVGVHLSVWTQANGEYVCRLGSKEGREALSIDVEWRGAATASDTAAVAESLRTKLGVRVEVSLVPSGSTAELTGVQSRQKPRRLVDER